MSGTTDTLSATSLPPREAIRFFLDKVNVPTAGWSDVWQEAHARGFMVAGAAAQDLLGDLRGAVAKAIEQGTTLEEFRRDFRGIVDRHGWKHTGTPGWRAQIIYETNLSAAYAAGRYAQLTEPETLAAFPYWQYVHSGARHPRLQHKAWNGLVLRADDAFWRTHYPPNGWKCGCRVRPLSQRDLARQGKSAPDTAPSIKLRSWTRPRDGKVLQVPEGIDPGFAYNVGEAWRGGPPPVPTGPHLSPPSGWVPPLPRGSAPPPVPPVALPAAGRKAFEGWLRSAQETPTGARPVPVAPIADEFRRALGLAAQTVVLRERKLQRIAGKDARTGRAIGLAEADVARIPELLGHPLAILRQRDNGNLIYVMDVGDPEGRLAKFVVRPDTPLSGITGNGRGKAMVAELISAGLASRANLADRAAYRLLWGEM